MALDKTQPFADIVGEHIVGGVPAKFEQDGAFFDAQGEEIIVKGGRRVKTEVKPDTQQDGTGGGDAQLNQQMNQ